MEIIIDSNVTINKHFAETTQPDQTVEKNAKNAEKAKESIVNHDEGRVVRTPFVVLSGFLCCRRQTWGIC